MELHADIEDGIRLVPEASSKGNSNIVQDIDKEIHCLPPLAPEPCIFKVNGRLRNANKKAYTPMLVSIGPYHHGNSKLRAMEEHKKRYLHSLLERRNETSVASYFLAMDKLADRALNCYADPVLLKREKFIQMMLLDACFTVELLRKCFHKELQDKDDPIFKVSWMRIQIYRDILLLENQLPFFVLSVFYDMSHTDPSSCLWPLTLLAMHPIQQMLPSDSMSHISRVQDKSALESKHFLDLVHNVCLPSYRDASSTESSVSRKKKPEIFSVVELQEAGIHFKVEETEGVSLFDITFEVENGCMKIPRFRVTDSTEIFLRNMIAYEQHSFDAKSKYFTDYTHLLDGLINTEKDVAKLRQKGIIRNILGDDEEVSRMINKLGDGRITETSNYFYSDVCEKVNVHCGKFWNRAKAKLRHDYFYTPWAGVSTVAAIILLLFTLTQTILALIGLNAGCK